jgi:hypothetical protein
MAGEPSNGRSPPRGVTPLPIRRQVEPDADSLARTGDLVHFQVP